MLNENLQFIDFSQEKARFTITLLLALSKLKENKNVDDVYINLNSSKLEIYVFCFEEDFECEDFIIETISEWEAEQKYFPELFINLTDEGKMNILPRGSMKIC